MVGSQEPSILIVDDSPDNIKIIGTFLQKEGYSIRAAMSGPAAIESASMTPPDLILMDVSMPGMNGYETCRTLSALDTLAQIPILFITAEKKGMEAMLEGFKAGGVDYIEKPVESAIIAARVRLHLSLLQARKRLEERNRELEEIDEWKTRLLSILGHDLRNPISGFRGLTEILVQDLDGLDHASLREYIVVLHRAAENTEALLENILTWASVSKRNEASLTSFALHPLLAEVDEQLHEMATAKDIRLDVSHPSEVLVYADIDMTRTMLRNLVSNAIKFTPLGGTVRLESRLNPKTMAPEIEVSDTGLGMPPEKLSRLFAKDLKSTWGTAGEKGSGLGLLICHELAEQQGCSLWAESVVGQGSRFHMQFQHYSNLGKAKRQTS
ncbi:MAG TPA: hybrid sensor histidine kinase/response regulator [bacterium]|nr:hybrid sensor histidine kinase/response regulator [bacterium]